MQKLKRFGLKNPRSLTLKDPKRYGNLNQLEFLCCRVQRMISGSWIVDAQDTWPEMLPSLLFLQKNEGYVTFGDNAKRRTIGQGNIGNDTSSLIESVLLVDGLKHNLLSISQLCDKGFKVIF